MKSILGWFGAHIVAILLTIALFAAALSLYDWLHPAPKPDVHADRVRVDTVTAWKTRQDTIMVRVDDFVAEAAKSAATGRVGAARMDSAAVSVADTAPAHAYALERERGDTLQALGWRLSVSLDTMTADRDRWRFVADTSVTLLNHVQRDLEVATRPCRIARVIPCPSRVAVFVGTALVTGFVVTHPDGAKKALRFLIPLPVP